MSGKRRRPYAVKKTVGWHWDEEKQKQIQKQITIGYAATRAEGLQMLAEYNNNPFDVKASKATFQEVYECWSKGKYPTISASNVKDLAVHDLRQLIGNVNQEAILFNASFKDNIRFGKTDATDEDIANADFRCRHAPCGHEIGRAHV